MDIPYKEIKNKSRRLAKNLIAQAEKNELLITADLQKIAEELSAEMKGLENRFKTVQSLTRKLANESEASAKVFINSGYSVNEAIEKSTKRQAERNNDALRYTFIFPLEKYIFGFKQSIEKLQLKGYEIPQKRIWNA